ncbi:MAG: hypothetical protein ACRDRI_06025 [Pseudonocardiaceae bacterium]
MSIDTRPDKTASPVRLDTLAEDTHTGVVRREDRVASKSSVVGLLAAVEEWEVAIHRWLVSYSMTALRISVGLVTFGFGILKYFPGVSPAQDLVLAAVRVLTFGLVPAVVPNSVVMVLLATVECVIGLSLITGRGLRVTSYLLMSWVLGILSPLVLLPTRLFDGPGHMPTLEGQYVLKDVILLAAAMAIITTVRGGAITDGKHRAPKAE